MFKVGMSVVHRSHGVGKIVSIEKREFAPGKVSQFYILEIEDGGAPKKFLCLLKAHKIAFAL